ncbi:MAG TPA: response regulator [Microlunatus sp.]|nr:response regulator [Microlunatus sp.]
MITVLVVDDDFRVARIHSAFVDRIEGFRTIGVANTGQEAIRLAVALVPDLILLDLYLPDVFGLDVLNRMRVAGVEGDAIVISAANESETVERAVKLGVVNYLLKPFTADDLRQRLTYYKANRTARHPKTLTDQAAVDQLWGRTEGGRSEPLPKGLSPETAELIVHALRATEGELSAQECADAVGISRVSARRYLEYFAGQGTVVVSLRYGVVGRPERRYGVARPDAPPPRPAR